MNQLTFPILPLISIEYPVIYVPIRHTSTSVENPLQIDLFMQNKPNVKDAQINVNAYMKSKYEKMDTWLSAKNKPNSNPIKPNFKKAKMNVNLYVIADYRKNDCLAVPKTNPIQSQSCPP